MEPNQPLNQEPDSGVTSPSSGQDAPTQPPTKIPKSRKVILLIVAGLTAVGLILVTTVALLELKKDRGDNTAQDIRTASITMTTDGFSPASLSIQKGTTVTWTNTGNTPRRIAADPHPEHTSLQGLDSKDPIGPEATYSYTFDTPGAYQYHDHFSPTTSGTIVVE
jgi:plastocyanin